MEGVYNIVSFDSDVILRGIDFLTITPTHEDKKKSWLWQSHRLPGQTLLYRLCGYYGSVRVHYGTMDTHRGYFIICTDDNMINKDNDFRTNSPTNEDTY